MTLERIAYFLDLVQTLNYTETAEHFYTTQSNVSKQIIALEKELDVTLFLRTHRAVSLAPAGKAFLPPAEKLYADYRAMLSAMSPLRQRAARVLRICSIPVMSSYNISGMLSSFLKSHPDITPDMKELESVQLLPALDSGTFEIACIRLFEADCPGYDKIVFDRDEFAAALPAGHPFANRTQLSLRELKDETFLQLGESTLQLQPFRQACLSAGFEPKISYTGTRLDNILSFVADAMGVSILMRRSVESLHKPGVAILPLAEPVCSELAFLRLQKKRHSDACNAFWEFLGHEQC